MKVLLCFEKHTSTTFTLLFVHMRVRHESVTSFRHCSGSFRNIRNLYFVFLLFLSWIMTSYFIITTHMNWYLFFTIFICFIINDISQIRLLWYKINQNFEHQFKFKLKLPLYNHINVLYKIQLLLLYLNDHNLD